MSTAHFIDTGLAGAAATRWTTTGDRFDDERLDLWRRAEELDLLRPAEHLHGALAGAAAELWADAVFLAEVVAEIRRRDVSVLGSPELIDRLWPAAGHRPDATTGHFSPPLGDDDGRSSIDLRTPFRFPDGSAADRGRVTLANLLRLTEDRSVIRVDEFLTVRLGANRWAVVAPGVVGMTQGDCDGMFGTDRNLRNAAASFGTADTGRNRYARTIADSLAAAGIPDGAELVLVGHSYGADTVVDLAASGEFTTRYRVTHVLAAGYASLHQLDAVQPGTRVMAIVNTTDLVVVAESAAITTAETVAAAGKVGRGGFSVLKGLAGVVGAGGQALVATGQAVTGDLRGAGDRYRSAASGAVGAAGDIGAGTARIGGGIADLVDVAIPDERWRVALDRDLLYHEFVSGVWGDAGHHPDRYADELMAVGGDDAEEFFAEVGAGLDPTTLGVAIAVDISSGSAPSPTDRRSRARPRLGSGCLPGLQRDRVAS